MSRPKQTASSHKKSAALFAEKILTRQICARRGFPAMKNWMVAGKPQLGHIGIILPALCYLLVLWKCKLHRKFRSLKLLQLLRWVHNVDNHSRSGRLRRISIIFRGNNQIVLGIGVAGKIPRNPDFPSVRVHREKLLTLSIALNCVSDFVCLSVNAENFMNNPYTSATPLNRSISEYNYKIFHLFTVSPSRAKMVCITVLSGTCRPILAT